jgi:hypothetical protein
VPRSLLLDAHNPRTQIAVLGFPGGSSGASVSLDGDVWADAVRWVWG